jgi:large subunit ribosomal protein L24
MAKREMTPHHLAHLKVLKGDEVMIITGSDRGKKGKVERTYPRTRRVIVEGMNMAKRRVKPRQGRAGGVVPRAMPMDVSNVMVICTECDEPTRVGYERVLIGEGDNRRERVRRVCKKCQQTIADKSRTVQGE